jgi:hypothetical protein
VFRLDCRRSLIHSIRTLYRSSVDDLNSDSERGESRICQLYVQVILRTVLTLAFSFLRILTDGRHFLSTPVREALADEFEPLELQIPHSSSCHRYERLSMTVLNFSCHKVRSFNGTRVNRTYHRQNGQLLRFASFIVKMHPCDFESQGAQIWKGGG